MKTSPFTVEDVEQASMRGISKENLMEQIEIFSRGTPFVRLLRPCTIDDGIVRLREEEHLELLALYEKAAQQGRLGKFVPASGAATRMFKNLTWFCEQPEDVRTSIKERVKDDEKFKAIWETLSNLKEFAFYDELEAAMAKDGLDIDRAMESGDFQTVLVYLLTDKGLSYNSLPKGLLKFHKYADHTRTALEEHLVEALNYSCDASGVCRIHFTVSPRYRSSFEIHLEALKNKYKFASDAELDVDLSEQSPSTDTIAVDMKNRPLRDSSGRLVFRPGGHGSLLKNLNELKGDIVFLKNVDNVVPDREKGPTYLYKKLLTGYLIKLQRMAFDYLRALDADKVYPDLIEEIAQFCQTSLNLCLQEELEGAKENVSAVLKKYLNRPIRVCGMVENRGEAGGGPFWVVDYDGNISMQIVEMSQIDKDSPTQLVILESSTHFNPVFIACGLRNYDGENFDLFEFRDPRAVFITTKYMNGRELRALEWPGLWNGSMAYWNTVFVEVPSEIFNPVKTINDLLQERHR